MKAASCLGEGLPVRCNVCGLDMSADAHRLRVTGPVEAYLSGGETTPADWERVAQRMALRHGQYADPVIFPPDVIHREVSILSARLLHYRASGAVAPREVA